MPQSIAQLNDTTALAWRSLLDELQGEYSAQLYQGPGRVDAKNLQLIWVQLLSNAALRKLETIGACRYQPKLPRFWLYAPHSQFANPQGSIWRHVPRQVAQPSCSWVEVSHCPKRSGSAGAGRLPWFYKASGSGISINVGRT